jgi:hypothetical protein
MSLLAPVVMLVDMVPNVVGVPLTVQVIAAPIATVPVVGTVGVHVVVKPAGKPAMAQVAPAVAAAVAAGAVLVQVKLPVYGTPTWAVVGMPAKDGTMSEAVMATITVPEQAGAVPVQSGSPPPVTVAVLLPPVAERVAEESMLIGTVIVKGPVVLVGITHPARLAEPIAIVQLAIAEPLTSTGPLVVMPAGKASAIVIDAVVGLLEIAIVIV